MGIKNIKDGWSNWAFENAEIEALAHERASVCSGCPHAKKKWYLEFIGDELEDIKGYMCTLCTCPLSGACRSPEHKCPLNKWQR